jgi:hypothetical protein
VEGEGGIGPSSTKDSKEKGGCVEQADGQVKSDFSVQWKQKLSWLF